jgi:hypothetical protein
MEYRIVKMNDLKDFSEKVNQLIAEGWTPLGGVSIAVYRTPDYETHHHYAQALTRDTTKLV